MVSGAALLFFGHFPCFYQFLYDFTGLAPVSLAWLRISVPFCCLSLQYYISFILDLSDLNGFER